MILVILPAYSTLNTTIPLALISAFPCVHGESALSLQVRAAALSTKIEKVTTGAVALNNAVTILWHIPKISMPSSNVKTTLIENFC